jgi:eukaryotic-like serine/threonine-protein kinase
MAKVYRARDTRLGRDVAIKVISEGLAPDGPIRERFEREARLAASLSHPNVVALYDVGFQDGQPYLVTELLRGETLRERLDEGPVPLRTALEWAAQIAQGLAAAHERGIIHRDLKLENVFITCDGQVKLLDFGIAKLVETAPEPHGLMEHTASHPAWGTDGGIVVGTPGYMSPEQVRSATVDARTDVFNLGVVLYEMLSGRPAFSTASVVESGYAILHTEPEPLPDFVPPQVAQVVRRCLEKESGRRYQSARDLAFQMELLTPAALREGDVPSGFKRPQWRRWLWPFAAIVGAAGLAVFTYFAGRGVQLALPSVERIPSRPGAVSAGRFTSDGRVVYSAAWGSGPEEIFTRARRSPDAQSLGITNARLLSVSANGELAVLLRPLWYGWATMGGTLALVPGIGGTPRPLSEDILYADWSPTGELAVVRSVNGTRQLEYPLGTPIFKTTGSIGFPRVSPSGDTVAFLSVTIDSGEVLVVDRKGAIRRLFAGVVQGIAWAPSGDEVWFSAKGGVWASPLRGGRRLLYQSLSAVQLEDISPDGNVLLNTEEIRNEMVFVPPGHKRERELPWLDQTDLVALSSDGRSVLFCALTHGEVVTFIWKAGESSPLKLGSGVPLAFSPDGQQVLVENVQGSSLTVLPVGIGVAKTLPVSDLRIVRARWLRDGERILVQAQRKRDDHFQLFVVPLDGGAPTPVPNGAVMGGYLEVSPDDRLAASNDPNGTLTVYPLAGGPPIPLPELGRFSTPSGWTKDGQLWATDALYAGRYAPTRLMRYDLGSRRVVEERTLSPTDLTGFVAFGDIFITSDGEAIAYQYKRIHGSLYLVEGLAQSRR